MTDSIPPLRVKHGPMATPHEHPMGVPVEVGELQCQRFNALLLQALFGDKAIEHASLIEASHLNEPINDSNSLADDEPCWRNRQRNSIQIDIGGKPPVQLDFSAAGIPALF